MSILQTLCCQKTWMQPTGIPYGKMAAEVPDEVLGYEPSVLLWRARGREDCG